MKIIHKLTLSYVLLALVVTAAGVILLQPLAAISSAARKVQQESATYLLLKGFESEALRLIISAQEIGYTGEFDEDTLVALKLGEGQLRRQLDSLTGSRNLEEALLHGEKILNCVEHEVLTRLYQGRAPDPVVVEALINGPLRDLKTVLVREARRIESQLANQAFYLSLHQQRMAYYYLPSIALLLMTGFLFIFILQRRALKSLGETSLIFRNIAGGAGGVTSRLPVKGKDEVAELCVSFNIFMEGQENRFRELLSLSDSHEQETRSLAQTVEQAHRSMEVLGEKVAGSDRRLVGLKRNLTETLGGAEGIGSSMESLRGRVDEVKKGVDTLRSGLMMFLEEQTTITKSHRHEEERIRELEHNLHQGRNALAMMEEKLRHLGGIIEGVRAALESFSEQAGRMDVVAVNAAINAARAGEQGRGFAITAREFKTLAVSLKEESTRITNKLEEVEFSLGELRQTSGSYLESQEGSLSRTDGVIRFIRELGVRTDRMEGVHNEVRNGWSRLEEGFSRIHGESHHTLTLTQEIIGRMAESSAAFSKQSEAFSSMTRSLAQAQEAFTGIQHTSEKSRQGFLSLNSRMEGFINPVKACENRKTV